MNLLERVTNVMTAALSGVSSRYPAIARVLIVSAGWHLITAIVKSGYGWKIHSVSMMADGFHSGIHASGVLFAIGGIYVASRPPDTGHPYGYDRYEPLTAMGVGVLMIAAIFGTVNAAVEHTRFDQRTLTDAGSFAVVVISVVGSGVLAVWEKRSALALSSTVLQADARRSWLAAVVSLSVVIGLLTVYQQVKGLRTTVVEILKELD